jgi:multicomponent Na+:H+ antiporter subunit G
MKTVAIEVLVGAAVLITLVSIAGMLRLRSPFQRMHFIAPPASLSALFVTVAIFLDRGIKPESLKALLTTLVLIGMNTIVTHAAARAFRIAEVEDWSPKPGEEVPILPSDELVSQEREQ